MKNKGKYKRKPTRIKFSLSLFVFRNNCAIVKWPSKIFIRISLIVPSLMENTMVPWGFFNGILKNSYKEILLITFSYIDARMKKILFWKLQNCCSVFIDDLSLWNRAQSAYFSIFFFKKSCTISLFFSFYEKSHGTRSLHHFRPFLRKNE